MTTQLWLRTSPELAPAPPAPDALFEEARRRRRRRWRAGATLVSAAVIAGALTIGIDGGGGGGAGNNAHGHPSGSGSPASSSHGTATRLFPDAPSMQRYYTGPGAMCTLAARSPYVPAWSGCVSAMTADLFGQGGKDLIVSYSRLGHVSMGVLPPHSRTTGAGSRLYPAEQAMLRIVTPDGHAITTPITYGSTGVNHVRGRVERAEASALLFVAHVGDGSLGQIFVGTGQISSGSVALVYSLHHGRLVGAGVVLGYGGDGASRASFQCVSGTPPRLIQRRDELLGVIPGSVDGWWAQTTTTYAWRGPRLVELARATVKRRLRPEISAGVGCRRGVR